MIKLKIKDKDDKGVSVSFTQNDTNTIEHIAGIIALYKSIKENTDYTDEEILRAVHAGCKGVVER